MLSIQDESVIPPQIQRALERVREGADTMPPGQLHKAIEVRDDRSRNTFVMNSVVDPVALVCVCKKGWVSNG